MRFIHAISIFIACFALSCASRPEPGARDGHDHTVSGNGIVPVGLRCEYLANPLGIDTAQPGLYWALQSAQRGQRQTAYQILVASTREKLDADSGDLWDTGKVASSQSVQVIYGGRPLSSGQRCYWKVRAWDKEGQPSSWSQPAWWEMGLLKPTDWAAKWINDGKPAPATEADQYKDNPAPLFRKSFSLNKRVKRARLYISGLGYYEASINGRRVGDHVLDPGWTSYSQRVLYSTYDVTEQVRKGSNCLAVMLGNGWYNPLPLRLWGSINLREHLTIGQPRFIAQLNVEYTDGSTSSILSDETWKVNDGPILRNNIYLGEVYDARREIRNWNRPGLDESAWRQACLATEPVGSLHAQMQPPIRATATLKPVKITEPKPGVFIVDMGQNFAGWATLRAHGPAGTTINLRYGELLYPDGTLNVMTSTCGQIKPPLKPDQFAPETAWDAAARFGPGAKTPACQGSTFILRGKGTEIYTPRFAFHGFRYVEITGYPGRPDLDDLEGIRLNADVTPIGTFECSNDLLNRVQTAAQWTFLSNLFSVQSDCPHREKFGYSGDIVPTCDALLFNYDMAPFYRKVVEDFADAARPSGGHTETAPFVGIADHGLGDKSGPIGWTLAHPLLQQKLYQYAGDRRLIEQQYQAVRRQVEFFRSKAPNHIIDICIGDHESLDPKPIALTSTAFYYHHVQMIVQFARLLGKEDDLRQYEALAQQIKSAFIARFLKGDSGQFDIGTQACQAFALAYDLVPPEQRSAAFDALIAQVLEKHKGHVATGIFGTRLLLDVLSQSGRADLAYTIASQEDFPGWGHMIKGGATTLWETWAFSDNTYSHNHPMFGSISAWFYEVLGGIRPDPKAVGFDRIIIRPQVVGDLKWVKCHHNSIRGPVASEWRIENGQLHLKMTIPPNTTATAYVPTSDPAKVLESGKPAQEAQGLRLIGHQGGAAVYELESGTYSFTVPRP